VASNTPTQSLKPWPTLSQRNFWRHVCSPRSRHPDSFYWYMAKIHGMQAFMRNEPAKQWFTRKLHKPYCEWKQNHYYRMFDAYKQVGVPCRVKLMTALPRGFLKTAHNVGSKMWAHLENPDFAVRLGSSDDDLARDIFASIPQIYRGLDAYAAYHLYYGNWFDPKRKNTRDELVHAARRNTARKEPSYKIFSITTGYKGHHPEIAELDDPVDREKLKTAEGSAHLQTANTSIIATRPAMPECSLYEITMTRYNNDDPHGHYQHQEGVRSWTGQSCWDPDVKISEKGEWDVYHLTAREEDTNESIAPELNTTKDLDAYEASNTLEFWNQMMNQPARGDHMGLDISQLGELYVSPEAAAEIPGDFIICVDTAFKLDPQEVSQDACESVYVIAKRDSRPTKADYYVYECYSSRTDRIEEFTMALVLKIQEYQLKRRRIYNITDERSPGKIGAWFHYLMNMCHSKKVICPPTTELPRGGGKKSKKIQRLRVAAGFWADGRIKIVRGAPGSHKLLSQMSRFEVSGIKDLADAAADLFHPDIYVVQAPYMSANSYGVRQVGPDDGELIGDTWRDPTGTADVIDTIWDNADPWS